MQKTKMPKTDLKNMNLDMLTDFVQQMGVSAFRARQIFSWLYRPGITEFSQMTDLSKDLRRKLDEIASISRLAPYKTETSEDGTIKYGFKLDDGAVIETVLIPEEDRNTLCVSSQVGCAMGCKFCLTGTMGLKRNLTPAEIVNQVCAAIEAGSLTGDKETTVSKNNYLNNLVFMGMGEPLANFDNVVTALQILSDQRGLDYSGRRITVSTCGIIPKMKALGEKTSVNLAVSLHAANDTVRNKLMPVNKTYPIDDLFDACRHYPLPRRRLIMIEYILIKDLNDSPADARELVSRVKDIRCKINLLPYNAVAGLDYESPDRERVEAFQKILWDAGYNTFIRTSRGGDISAACGQLAVAVGQEEE